MERIASLLQQLQEAYQQKADPSHLLMLVNMLQAELQQQVNPSHSSGVGSRVAVVLPGVSPRPEWQKPLSEQKQGEVPEKKVVEVLQVDETELEAELEEIRKKASFSEKIQAKQGPMKPGVLFEDEIDNLPTFAHQPEFKPQPTQERKKEVNEYVLNESSVNDRLKEEKTEVVRKLSEAPVKDLKKAIGINDRFVFMNELFRGDETMYERSIKTINNFPVYAEAQFWMERELKIKLGWDDESPATQEFYALVKRRFS
jgi:hypothetical protein